MCLKDMYIPLARKDGVGKIPFLGGQWPVWVKNVWSNREETCDLKNNMSQGPFYSNMWEIHTNLHDELSEINENCPVTLRNRSRLVILDLM